MLSVRLVHFDLTADQSAQMGLTHYDDRSWGDHDPSAYKDLLIRAAIIEETACEIIPCFGKISKQTANLATTFDNMLSTAVAQERADLARPDVLIVNLAPFVMTRTIGDAFVRGLASHIEQHFTAPITIVVICRDKTWFESHVPQELVRYSHHVSQFVAIDLEGMVLRYSRDGESVDKCIEEVPTSIYDPILNFKDEKHFRDSLIYQTNINIGHFKLPKSHVRTHYNLMDFVQRDNVFQHLNRLFTELTEKHKNVLITTCGLEISALTTLAGRFRTANAHVHDFQPAVGRILTDEDILRWVEDSDCVFILTDIVNSGTTVNELLARIMTSIDQVKSFAEFTAPRIVVLTIIAMKNTTSTLRDGVKLNHAVKLGRVYYDPVDDCTLCKLKQPWVEVRRAEDFAQVSQKRLTPLDYWEMVEDCNALVSAQERGLVHRVDTLPIISKYGRWLERMLAHQLGELYLCGLDPPAAIVTTDQIPGREFSKIVSRAMHRLPIHEVCIATYHIRGSKHLKIEAGLPVIVVDDGINTGETIKQLIDFAVTVKLRVHGAVVLDNRLSEPDVLKIEQSMQPGARVWSMYAWPVGDLRA